MHDTGDATTVLALGYCNRCQSLSEQRCCCIDRYSHRIAIQYLSAKMLKFLETVTTFWHHRFSTKFINHANSHQQF